MDNDRTGEAGHRQGRTPAGQGSAEQGREGQRYNRDMEGAGQGRVGLRAGQDRTSQGRKGQEQDMDEAGQSLWQVQ